MTMDEKEAREELRKRAEGPMADSIDATLEYLRSEGAADLIRDAGLSHLSTWRLLTDLTGVTRPAV
jgi:hypothetical protein